MAIKFFIEIDGKRYMLPVNPSSISVDIPNKNETNEVVKLGEITQFAPLGLKAVSFDSFFPLSDRASYLTDGSDYKKPQDWIELLAKAAGSQKAQRFIITDTKINMLVSIDAFDWAIEDSSGDISYSLSLKEYREYSAKYVQTLTKKVSVARKLPANPRPAVTQNITIGCTVIVNGRLRRDSYGSAPGQTEVNATRKVSHIVSNPRAGQEFQIHVTTLNGGWRGWVRRSEVRRI